MKALHYFSDDAGNDGDKTYVRIGFKGATQINDMLTGYGQWNIRSPPTILNPMAPKTLNTSASPV